VPQASTAAGCVNVPEVSLTLLVAISQGDQVQPRQLAAGYDQRVWSQFNTEREGKGKKKKNYQTLAFGFFQKIWGSSHPAVQSTL